MVQALGAAKRDRASDATRHGSSAAAWRVGIGRAILRAHPNPALAFQISLDSVACPAPRSLTAVGDYGVNPRPEFSVSA
jgi:hypothetical protein